MTHPIRIAALACAVAAAVAHAHPEFVGDYSKDLDAERKRSALENEAHGRFLIESRFVGSPVHEEQTMRSLTLSGVLGRAFDLRQARDRAFLRGVFWNDDPEADLWSDDKSKGPDALGLVWLDKFTAAKERATATPPYFFHDGDALLGRSHFGDLQFLHAMAERDGVAAADTQAKILRWMEFVYGVAQGRIAGSARLADVPVAGIAALFANDPKILNGTVAQLLRDQDVREVAAGSLLHVIQDSYAGGHAQRERIDRTVSGLSYFGRGAVLRYHAYAGQDPDKHKEDDRLPPTLRLNAPLADLGDDPVYHGAALLRMVFGADGQPPLPWPAAQAYLRDKVFAAAPAVQLSGPGECYKPGPLPAGCPAALASRDVAAGPRKLALLIGIDDYLAVTKLQGAVNDALSMKALLVQKFGFAEENVVVLLDRQATRAAILAAVKDLAARAQPGDVVLIHFSGHGSQAPDTDGDEDDGMDETIVPVDSRQGDVYDITDDEIGGWIRELNKATPNVVLVMDSCHSGTGARLADVALSARAVAPDPRLGPPRAARGTDARGVSPLRDPNAKDLRWVAISGSRADELSYEYADGQGLRHGALTYFLVRSLREAGPSTTYRDIHERVAQEVAIAIRVQHPQIDGPGFENAIFAAGSIAAEPFYTARAYGDGIALDAGRVHGVGKGATFKLYPPGTKTFRGATSIGTIEVTEALAYSSLAALKAGGFAAIGVMRAVEEQRAIEDFVFRVHLDANLPAGAAAAARAAAAKDRGMLITADAGDNPHVALSASGGELLLRPAGDTIGRIALGRPDLAAAIGSSLRIWLKWFRLLDLANPGGSAGVTLELLQNGAGADQVCPGARITAQVRNSGTAAMHVQLLNLDYDGRVSAPLNLRAGNVSSVLLKPGDPPVVVQLTAGTDPPFPRTEYLKLFATDVEVDLTPLQQDGARSAQPSALGRMLQETLSGGARVTVVPPDNWATVQRQLVTRRAAPECP